MEALRFGGAFLLILKQVLTAELCLEKVYLCKVDLADAYKRLWVRMEDVPYAAFLIPKKTPRNTHLVGFHISVPMGYINSAPYFCMAMETVADLAKEAISKRDQVGEHALDLAAKSRAAEDASAHEAQADASWEDFPAEQRSDAQANVNVYLVDCISVIQGGPIERHQMLCHLFNQIDRLFRPNEEADTKLKEAIYLMNLGQGDGAWSTRKTVLGWDLDTYGR